MSNFGADKPAAPAAHGNDASTVSAHVLDPRPGCPSDSATSFPENSRDGRKQSAPLIDLVGEISSLGLLAGIIHGFVLFLVFPGFYAPTLFDHSDFYIPVALFHSAPGLLFMLAWPRPIGMAYLYATGALGVQGSVLATLGVILLNITLVQMIVRRACHIDLTIGFFICAAAFDLLIFAQPFFFAFAIHDALAQVSFFFLCVGFIFIVLRPQIGWPELAILGTASFCAFLTKETFAVSAVWLALLIGYQRCQNRIVTIFVPALVIIAAFAAAAAYNLRVHSPFIEGSSDSHSPYAQTHNIWIILTQFRDYVGAGMPLASIGLFLGLFIACWFGASSPRRRWAALALPVAGIAALLPNSVLPNHYFPGYSWNMGYLFFAPVLLVSAITLRRGLLRTAAPALVFAFAAAMPYFWHSRYALSDWSIAEGIILRNMDRSLDVLTTAAAFDSNLAVFS